MTPNPAIPNPNGDRKDIPAPAAKRPLAEELPEPLAVLTPAAQAHVTPLPPGSIPPPPTKAMRDNADPYLRKANLLRLRKDYDGAVDQVIEALSVAPDGPTVALLADIQREAGKTDDAAASYERALVMTPPGQARTLIESKLARLIFDQKKTAEEAHRLAISKGSAGTGGTMTIVASAILPGLGQILVGKNVVGGIILAVYIVAAGSLTSITIDALANRSIRISALAGDVRMIALSIVSTILWLYSVADSTISARRQNL